MSRGCSNCTHDKKRANQLPCRNCFIAEHWEPMTNADRIRAMTDEELADTIHAVSLGWKGETNWCDFHCENPGEDGCDKCILNWLQQPCSLSPEGQLQNAEQPYWWTHFVATATRGKRDADHE